jgi:peptidoglycan hydrolase CwlO-like protein
MKKMFSRFFFLKIAGIFLVVSFFVFFLSFENSAQASFPLESCESIDKVDEECNKLSSDACKALLEKCQSYLEEKSNKIEKDIEKTAEEKATLNNQISLLGNKIQSLSYQINQSTVSIKNLSIQIEDTEESINNASSKVRESSDKLISVLRTINEEDKKSIVEIFLSKDEISGFFDDLVALEALSSKSKDLLGNIKDLKVFLEDQKMILSREKQDLEGLVAVQSLQKEESEETREEREYLLRLTEAEYQQYLREKEETSKKTAEIMARIYKLVGVREAVTYEEAIEIAKYAASQAGIRPALLLGVLSQESAIGKNVGQCYVTNPQTGDGVRANTGQKLSRVMNPTRDISYFLQVIDDLNEVQGLNLDPYETLVSCPMSIGWGGAMGPAQFIPSTWVGSGYAERVKNITGFPADPWDMRDASLAASLYLRDGIDKYGREGSAVQAYFCGSPRGDYWCNWYESGVLSLADCHQSFIDNGQMSAACENKIF